MTKKTPVLLNICAVISLIIFGYLLFFTVYSQMISQSEGFFSVIVFGGILILAFILLSLMTKLLAFSRDSDDSVGFLILEIVFLLALSVLFFKARISYESTIAVDEKDVQKAGELLYKGTLSVGGWDIMPRLMRHPATFFMGWINSVAFTISGTVSPVMIYINTSLLLATAFLSYGIVRRIGSRICSLFAFALTLFMPSNGFSVYNYDAQLLFAFVLMLAIFFSVLPMTGKKGAGSVVSAVFSGIFFGLALCMDPVCILLLLCFLFLGKIGNLSVQMAAMILGISILVFFGMLFVMSFTMEAPLIDLLQSFGQRFNPFMTEEGNTLSFTDAISNFNKKIDAQYSITENRYSLVDADNLKIAWMLMGSQILYMFLLILAIACAFYMIRSGNPRILPILCALIAGFLMILLSSGIKEYNSQFFQVLLLMTASVSLHYMYENHHALADENLQKILGDEEEEEAPVVEEETEEEKAAFLARAQALIFVGMNEEFYKQIKMAEKRQRMQKAEGLEEQPVPQVTETVDMPINKEIAEDIADETTEESTDAQPAESLPVEEEPQKKIEYLENPLPVPKKPQHKELDFDRVNVGDEDEDADFDFPDDGDDFDFDDDFDI